MKARVFAVATAALWMLAVVGAAHARNPHCAGGIQYVVNGMKDKDKGNTEDYMRQMNKAVYQLSLCETEDPDDYEAIGYLGWAFAELDSSSQAGKAFTRALNGLEKKGDRKKVEWVKNNRDSYWANAFNEGIQRINDAQAAYPDYAKEPENEADETLKEEARKRYEEAITSLRRASYLKTGDAQTMRNLGTAYAFMARYDEAAEVFQAGLNMAPEDEDLQKSLRSVRTQFANEMINEKRYDEAIAYFTDLVKADPENADLHLGLADARFRLAQTVEADVRKAAFKAAGESYAKASELRPDDADLAFNAALAFQNAQDWHMAEAQWQKTLELRPEDVDALSAYASTLAELMKYDDAVEALLKAIASKPREQTLHRQLGAVYTKAGDNEKATEELMVYLALSKGEALPDAAGAAAKAKKGSQAAKTFASDGAPDMIVPWEADGEKYETWFYWPKHNAYHFKAGALQVKSDWSAAAKYMTADG